MIQSFILFILIFFSSVILFDLVNQNIAKYLFNDVNGENIKYLANIYDTHYLAIVIDNKIRIINYVDCLNCI